MSTYLEGTTSREQSLSSPQPQAPNELQCSRCNVGRVERMLSAVAGGGMLAFGLRQRSLPGLLLALGGGGLVYRAATGHCYLYDQLGVDTARREPHDGVRAMQGEKHDVAVVINRDAEQLYAYWRELENLPRLFEHLERVEPIDQTQSLWVARDPFGRDIQWQAEIHNEVPGEMIAWRSLAGSQLDTAGSIHFKPLSEGRGTAVTLTLKYDPPAGRTGAAVAKMLGSGMESEISTALRRLKQVMESGELATTAGQPRGQC